MSKFWFSVKYFHTLWKGFFFFLPLFNFPAVLSFHLLPASPIVTYIYGNLLQIFIKIEFFILVFVVNDGKILLLLLLFIFRSR